LDLSPCTLVIKREENRKTNQGFGKRVKKQKKKGVQLVGMLDGVFARKPQMSGQFPKVFQQLDCFQTTCS